MGLAAQNLSVCLGFSESGPAEYTEDVGVSGLRCAWKIRRSQTCVLCRGSGKGSGLGRARKTGPWEPRTRGAVQEPSRRAPGTRGGEQGLARALALTLREGDCGLGGGLGLGWCG